MPDIKRVTVVGFGESAKGAIKLLKNIGVKVKVSSLSSPLKGEESILEGVEDAEFGKHTPQFVKGQDLIVTSPGVKPSSSVLRWAYKFGVEVIDEIELAYRFCKSKIIAITGTNGKSTTTYLLYNVLKDNGFAVYMAGNIGVSLSSIVLGLNSSDWICVEVSSFQLKRIKKFRPFIGIMLKLTEDHLDWHSTLKDYISSKWNIFKNQKQTDFSLINIDNISFLKKNTIPKAKIIFFKEDPIYNENINAVVCCSHILGIEENKVLDSVERIKSLPHRIEFVGVFGNKEVYNDSKATNISSTIFALKSLRKDVILICGGRGKNQNFSILRCNPYFLKFVKKVIVMGESSSDIRNSVQDIKKTIVVSNLEEAVYEALNLKSPETVLFSPMCASFDMFSNYQERGEKFKYVLNKYYGK